MRHSTKKYVIKINGSKGLFLNWSKSERHCIPVEFGNADSHGTREQAEKVRDSLVKNGSFGTFPIGYPASRYSECRVSDFRYTIIPVLVSKMTLAHEDYPATAFSAGA
jgi:hypothetical protein